MTKVRELLEALEGIAPFSLQESYDNAGLLVGDADQSITGVLTCLDSTPEVVAEAVRKNCNVIVAHHPIVFSGLKRITGKNYVEKTVIEAIKNDIAIIAIHTNLDNVLIDGVNEKIAQKIGLTDLDVLCSKDDLYHQGHPVGSGIIGNLKKKMDATEFLQHLKSSMELPIIKYTTLVRDQISKVAICGGSGSFLLSHAIDSGADIFITGDYKYHDFFDADGKIIIADIGHYESEKYTIDLLHEIITRIFSTFATHKTEVITNPVNYI